MPVTPDQNLSWSLASLKRNKLTNNYEPLQPYVLAELSRSCDAKVLLDVGANIGFYSIFLADELGLTRVYAYEPMPAAFNELIKNIKLNRKEKIIQPMKCALSNQKGQTEMHVFGGLSGANAIVKTSIHNDKVEERVETVVCETIDGLFSDIEATVIVKIDVEGHEKNVIDGGEIFLKNNSCVIQVEAYAGSDVEESLTRIGYKRLMRIGPDHYYTNIIALATDAAGILERALENFVRDSKADSSQRQPIRRNIFPHVTLELSVRLSDKIRSIFRR